MSTNRGGEPAVQRRETEPSALTPVGRLVGWVVKLRWWVLAVSLLFTALAASGLPSISLNHSYKAFLSPGSTQLDALESIEQNFVKEDNVFFVIKPKQGDVFQADVLQLLWELTDAAWQLPHATRVDSLVNFQYSSGQDDDLIVQNLVPKNASLTPSELQAIRDKALTDPRLRGLLVADDGGAAGINVLFHYEDQDPQENLAVEQAATALQQQFAETTAEVEIRHMGVVSAHAATIYTAWHDVKTLFSLAGVLVLLGLLVFLRRLVAVAACLGVTLLSILATVGLVGYAGLEFTVMTSSAPIVIMTLAVADSIHIMLTVMILMRDGMTKQQAIVSSLERNFLAVLLTTVTTAIGFFTFNFSEFNPLVDFGNIVALGIVLAFLYSVIWLPAFVAILPLNPESVSGPGRLARQLEALGNWIIGHRQLTIAASGALCLIAAIAMTQNRVNDSMFEWFDENSEYLIGTSLAAEHLTGQGSLIVSMNSGTSGGISDPVFLQKVEAFSEWLRQRDYVRHVATYTDTIKRLNQNLHGDDDAAYRLPESRELAAQYLLLYELSLPYGQDLATQINLDKSGVRIVATITDMNTIQIRSALNVLDAWFSENAPDVEMHRTGATTEINYLMYENMIAMLQSAAVAFVIIGLCLVATFRSVTQGLIGMTGVVMPLVMMFGLLGLISGEVGLAASIVIGVSLGIVVDNSVHLISKFNMGLRSGAPSRADALRQAFRTVGPALFINTTVLGTGFFVLAFSKYGANAALGLLSALTFIFALILTFSLVAPLLLLSRRKPAQ